ncbi:hypothetical protein LOK49_LG07G02871 [Camellia lanceoleosa]|uniref:Uncharacterized protein n=1 Tax=Camellia lanceoleosa TaxID=1840588 RepID=A0ACC0H254_9ERIC|nr:hypothetical protein LOK49_LG07G02871 [Camellia lanceoleosa]
MHGHIRLYCYELHGRVSHRDGRNSNISWGRRHFIGCKEVKGHNRPRDFDVLETKHGASLHVPRSINRKLEITSRQVLIERKGNHNVKTLPKNRNSHNFVHTKAVWEKLCSKLKVVLKSKPDVDVVKLQKSGGVVSRNSKVRQQSRSYRIRQEEALGTIDLVAINSFFVADGVTQLGIHIAQYSRYCHLPILLFKTVLVTEESLMLPGSSISQTSTFTGRKLHTSHIRQATPKQILDHGNFDMA